MHTDMGADLGAGIRRSQKSQPLAGRRGQGPFPGKQSLQQIYDAARNNPNDFARGESGYIKAKSGDTTFLFPHNLMGGPTYIVRADGSVYGRPVLKGADFELLGGPGSVMRDAANGPPDPLTHRIYH